MPARSRSAEKLFQARWMRGRGVRWPGMVLKWNRPPYKARRNAPGMHVRFQQVARIRPRHQGLRVERIDRALHGV